MLYCTSAKMIHYIGNLREKSLFHLDFDPEAGLCPVICSLFRGLAIPPMDWLVIPGE